MLDIGLLNRPFPASENPGLDTLDPRFQEIASLVQKEEVQKAAEQSEVLFKEEIFDIRLIGYYAYAIFNEQKMPSLASIFSTLQFIFTQNWETVGPAQKKERHTKTSVSWFLGRLLKGLEFHQNKNDEVWQEWIKTTPEEAQKIADACDEFRKSLSSRIEDAGTLELCSKVNQWMQDFYKIVYVPEQPAVEATVVETPQQQETSQQTNSASFANQQSIPSGETFEGSYPLFMLNKKIDAFVSLVEKGNFQKAAIVADDINASIEHFDPRIYLPKLFSKYYKTLSERINEISPNWDMRESIPWNAMSNFYRVDMDAFSKE